MDGLINVLAALTAGVVPAAFWLFVWHRHDAERPEPAHRVAYAFIAGILCVPVAIVFQTKVGTDWIGTTSYAELATRGLVFAVPAIAIWAFIEEALKFVACWIAALRSRDADEPMDPVMYLITTGLGFAAMENALYFISPISSLAGTELLHQGINRFIGSTLVHVASSALVGMAWSLTMFAFMRARLTFRLFGLVCATALHLAFNVLMIMDEHFRIAAFALTWTACVSLVVLFEKIKQVHLNAIINEEA